MKRALGAAEILFCLLLGCRARERSGTEAPPPLLIPAAEPVLGYVDESGEGPPVDGGVLQRRLLGEPGTLNAVLQTGLPEQQVLQYLSRNLLDLDARLNLVPGLAEKYEVSPDGLVYRFTLRANAVWEDGVPVTARDAVFTIRRVADPKVPSPVFKPLFEDLVSVEALDARNFLVKFRRSYAYRAMSFVLPLLPERRFAGRTFVKCPDNRAPFSNGPYRFVKWKSQESIELERNPRYWGPRGHFERVVFRIMPENAVSYRALLQGGLDETGIDQTLKERGSKSPEFQSCCRTVEFYDLDYNFIGLNNRSPFFSDARVRRALTMLLDRAAVVRSLFGGAARIISGPWAPDSPAYDATVLPLPFEPAAAARLLDQAGWRDSNGNGTRDRGGVEFDFELLVSAGSTVGRQINELLSGELARAGVMARVRPIEWAAFVERLDAGDYEAASQAWSASDPNPDPYPFWHSSQWPPRGLNGGFYRNREADRIMEEAVREMDETRRLELYHRLHRIFRDDAPAIFVTNTSKKYAFRRRVRGLMTSPVGLFGIWPGPLGWWSSNGPGSGDRPVSRPG